MTRRIFFAAIICAAVGVTAGAEERKWQSGTWREAKIERPKVLFSVQSRDPNSTLPRTAAAREIRTFVIDTQHASSRAASGRHRRHATHRRAGRPAGGHRDRKEDGVREGR